MAVNTYDTNNNGGAVFGILNCFHLCYTPKACSRGLEMEQQSMRWGKTSSCATGSCALFYAGVSLESIEVPVTTEKRISIPSLLSKMLDAYSR